MCPLSSGMVWTRLNFSSATGAWMRPHQVRGKWTYLYRAVDKRGDTIDFYLSPTRSAKAAKRFLGKALRGLKDWERLRKLNTDKAPSYDAAIGELKREGKLDQETEHRQVKYLNNVIETDHGKLKMLIKPVRFQVDAHGLRHDQRPLRPLRRGAQGSGLSRHGWTGTGRDHRACPQAAQHRGGTTIKEGRVPEAWKPAKARQKDRDAR